MSLNSGHPRVRYSNSCYCTHIPDSIELAARARATTYVTGRARSAGRQLGALRIELHAQVMVSSDTRRLTAGRTAPESGR